MEINITAPHHQYLAYKDNYLRNKTVKNIICKIMFFTENHIVSMMGTINSRFQITNIN